MICSAKGNLRARATTATIALAAGGYLVMSGMTAEPAAGEGWLTEVRPGTAKADPAEDKADPQYLGAKTGDTADSPARARKKADGKEDLFRPGPQYDENYNAQGNVDIYGAKKAVEPPRPPIELVASNTPPANTIRAAPYLVKRTRCYRALPSTATGGRQSPTTATTARILPRSRPG